MMTQRIKYVVLLHFFFGAMLWGQENPLLGQWASIDNEGKYSGVVEEFGENGLAIMYSYNDGIFNQWHGKYSLGGNQDKNLVTVYDIKDYKSTSGEWSIITIDGRRHLQVQINESSRYEFVETELGKFEFELLKQRRKAYALAIVEYAKIDSPYLWAVYLRVSNAADVSITKIGLTLSTVDSFGDSDGELPLVISSSSNGEDLNIKPNTIKYIKIVLSGGIWVWFGDEKIVEPDNKIDYLNMTRAKWKLVPQISSVKIAFEDGSYVKE